MSFWRAWLTAIMCALPAAAAAAPTIEILSPAPGVCYNNGGEIYRGGIPGGEGQPDPRAIAMDLRLSEPNGAPILLEFFVDGAVVMDGEFIPDAAGQVQDTAIFALPGLSVEDNANFELRIVATVGEDSVEDVVSFRLDRRVPNLDFGPRPCAGANDCFEGEACGEGMCIPAAPCGAEGPCVVTLDELAGCLPQQPTVYFVPVDDQDPNPVVAQEPQAEGCLISAVYTITDDCGNAQEMAISARQSPAAGVVTVSLQGYECGLNGCVLEGEDAVPFDEGGRVGRGAIAVSFDAPLGCSDEVASSLVGPVMPDELAFCFADGDCPGQVEGSCVLGQCRPCQGDNECPTNDAGEIVPNACMDTGRCRQCFADADCALAGEAIEEGVCQEGRCRTRIHNLNHGEPLDVPGDYTASISVSACGAEVAAQEMTFTILPRPVAHAGGPYEAVQGAPLTLSAADSVADDGIGGITELAWDLDADGFFDVVGPPAEAMTADFDTAVGDGEYYVLLKVTAGNGAVEFASAQVIITDVDPTCAVGGPYAAEEGQAIEFDASDSAPGHASDPLVAYNWDFGDHAFPQRGADLTNPSHIYGESGEFTVTVRIEDEDSFCEAEALVVISDCNPEISGHGALNAEHLTEGEPVRFSAGETAPCNAFDPITRFTWNFGDLSPIVFGESMRQPEHVYAEQGSYNVCLTVDDEDGQTEGCFDIEVADLQPIAVASLNSQGPFSEGDEICFEAYGSLGNEVDQLTAIRFDWGDGESTEVRGVALADPVACHVFETQGAQSITVFAADEDSEASTIVEFFVEDAVPQAVAVPVYPTPEQVAYEGVAVQLDASASEPGAALDPIVSYTWSFGDGVEETTDTPLTAHAYPNQGIYQVLLTVEDSDGSVVGTTFAVRVINVAPIAEITADNMDVELGTDATFRLSVDDVPGDLPPRLIIWDMGDGTEYTDQLSVTHSYDRTGARTITATVADDEGEVAVATLIVDVTLAGPTIEILEPLSTAEGEALTFRLHVDSAPRNGGLDGPVELTVIERPPGMTSEAGDDGEPEARSWVDLHWTPTYYDTGHYEVVVSAISPFGGIHRRRTIEIDVTEAGEALLVGLGGTSGRGRVTLYSYSRSNLGHVSFQRSAQINVGLGAAGMVADPLGQRLFVAVPGSGVVSVVGLTGDRRLLRQIPTGIGTSAVVWGDDLVWALNSGEDTLTVIDPVRLKVIETITLAPLQGVTDLAWLPAGFADINDARLAIVSRSGHVALVDPNAALAGQDGVVEVALVGGMLSRVSADLGRGELIAHDGKTRQLYRIDAATLDRGLEPDVDGYELVFGARDLTATPGGVVAATDAGLFRLEGDELVELGLEGSAVAPLPEAILSGGGLVVFDEGRVSNLGTPDWRVEFSDVGQGLRRLLALVALE